MRLTRIICFGLVPCLWLLLPLSASAAPIGWIIDSTQSSLKLSIPDQPVVIDGFNATVRVRNQNSSQNNAWNVGNTAALSGVLNTDYTFNSIEFLAGSSISFLNSGSYRPNPAAYSLPLNPDGIASGGVFTNTTSAAAVYAGRLRTTTLLVTNDAFVFSLYNMVMGLQSGTLPMSGGFFDGDFAANSIAATIGDGRFAVDTTGITIIPDEIGAFGNVGGTNATPLGSIEYSGLVGTLTLPINFSFPFALTDDVALTAQFTGQIVAHYIPEPSTLVLSGLAIAVLGSLAWRRSLLARRSRLLMLGQQR